MPRMRMINIWGSMASKIIKNPWHRVISKQMKNIHIIHTHHYYFGTKAHVILPGNAQHIWKVEGEVYDAPAGRGEVSAREKRADQETLHDGHYGKGGQEQVDYARVAVRQEIPHLNRQ